MWKRFASPTCFRSSWSSDRPESTPYVFGSGDDGASVFPQGTRREPSLLPLLSDIPPPPLSQPTLSSVHTTATVPLTISGSWQQGNGHGTRGGGGRWKGLLPPSAVGGTKPTHNEQNRGERKGLSQFPLHSLSHPSLWELYFWSSGGCMGKGGNLRPQPVAYCIIYLGEEKGFPPRREEMFLLFLPSVFATLWSSRETRAIYYSGRVFSALFCTQTNRFFQKQKGKKEF